MDILPERSSFQQHYGEGRNQVLWTDLVADMDTAVSLMLKLTQATPDSFMLESVTGGEIRGRYSVIGMKPDLIWRCRGEKAEINRNARIDADSFEGDARDPQAIDTLLICDGLLRTHDVAKRKRLIAVVDSVRENGGTVRVFSSMHITGERKFWSMSCLLIFRQR